MKRMKHDNGTRERLLESACEVFAREGFWNATVAEICKLADTNIAAVNYHFHNKEALYAEAWRQAFTKSVAEYPPDGGVSPQACAEERLRGRIIAVMRRLDDPASHEFDIITKEIANPTGLLTEVIQKTIEPLRQELTNIIAELLGDGATEKEISLCRMSIMSQCFDMMYRVKHRGIFNVNESNIGIEEMAEHIMRFSLAGINEIRRQIETDKIENSETAKLQETAG